MVELRGLKRAGENVGVVLFLFLALSLTVVAKAALELIQ